MARRLLPYLLQGRVRWLIVPTNTNTSYLNGQKRDGQESHLVNTVKRGCISCGIIHISWIG